MKKLFFCLLISGLAFTSLTGQTERGNLLLGGNAGINLRTNENTDDFNFTLNLSPRVGLFLIDNLAVGARASGSIQKFANIDGINTQLVIGPFARYYFHNLFVETNFGLNRGDFDVGFGLGYAIFISPNVALEPIANLNVLNGFDLNILAGFQLYFSPGELNSSF